MYLVMSLNYVTVTLEIYFNSILSFISMTLAHYLLFPLTHTLPISLSSTHYCPLHRTPYTKMPKSFNANKSPRAPHRLQFDKSLAPCHGL